VPVGNAAEIVRRFHEELFDLVLSEAILAEFQEVMAYDRLRRRHRFSDEEISAIMADFIELATMVEPAEQVSVVRDDPDDDKFLEAAIAGEAEFIVSGDHHLLQLRTYRGIRIVTPATFLVLLRQDDASS
jgi:putative PIN family toxin of toxin-antitoxin system